MTDWVVTPLAPALGARVVGVDLEMLDSDGAQRLADLLDDYLVLALPGQQLSIEGHIRIGELFGEPLVHPFLEAIPEHPAILQVLKEPDDEHQFGGEFWHCDISFIDPPASVSVLHGIEIPPVGGDTLFANTRLAYDRLSPSLADFLSTLTTTHVYPDMDETPSTAAVHPLVRVHPRTGRSALYVNEAFVVRINELAPAESDHLLRFLHTHQTAPEFQVRVSWEAGQVLLWDNRATVHYAMNDYHGHRRRLQRVTSMEREM